MRATLSRSDFAAALAAVSPAIPLRPSAPILTSVHIEVRGGRVQIRATDYQLTIERFIDAKDTADGVALVSGLRLRDLVKQLSGNTVVLTLDGTGLLVAAGRSKYTLSTFPADEFPEVPPAPPAVGSTTSWALENAARIVTHSLATDPQEKKSCYGVSLQVKDGALWASTTDAFRLAATPIPWAGDDFQCRLIHAHLLAVGKNLAGDVTVGLDENRISFTGADASITAVLIDGDLLPWDRIMAVTPATTHEADRAELIAALTRTALVLERNQPVKVTCEGDSIGLSSRDDQATGIEVVEAAGDGDTEFGVNPGYLTALLNAISEDRVAIYRPTSGRPLLVRGLSEDQTPSETAHIVMPLKLNS